MPGEPTAERPRTTEQTKTPSASPSPEQPVRTSFLARLLRQADSRGALSKLAELRPANVRQKTEQIRENLRLRAEKRRLLKDAEALGITNKEMFGQILDGYYDARRWSLDRFVGVQAPQLLFDVDDLFVPEGNMGAALVDSRTILLSPRGMLEMQKRLAQSGNILDHDPRRLSAATPKQFGQEFAVEEITHIAQFEGATDKTTGEKLASIPTTPLRAAEEGSETYDMQPHEKEAWKYKWLFYEDQVKQGELSTNPLTEYVTSLGINTTQLK